MLANGLHLYPQAVLPDRSVRFRADEAMLVVPASAVAVGTRRRHSRDGSVSRRSPVVISGRSGETQSRSSPTGVNPDEGGVVAAIQASIEVDVPLEFADLEWSEFMLDSLLSGYTRGLTDVEPLIDQDDIGLAGST